MIYAKDSVDWARKHATFKCGSWYCRKTRARMKLLPMWRTIGADSDFPFNGLEVKKVQHVFCPKCSKSYMQYAPRHGNQIALNNLIGYKF